MAKRIRNPRRIHSQRRFDAIEREIQDAKFLTKGNPLTTTPATIDERTDLRDPIEMARAAGAALKHAV